MSGFPRSSPQVTKLKGNHTMLPSVTEPVRLNDLPAILGPYAKTAPIFVYLMSCGNLTASRFRLGDEEDLILVLGPRGRVA